MIVLALDLASRTGWAVGGGGMPKTGVYNLSGGSRGHGFLGFNNWLYGKIDRTGAELIAYEKPLFSLGKQGIRADVGMKLIGLAAMAEMIGAARGIPVVVVAVQPVRKAFLGHGRPANPKQAVLDRCKLLGWETGGDDNRGDAAALWFWAKATHDPKFNIETGNPVFAGT
jgi:hypothetical protein